MSKITEAMIRDAFNQHKKTSLKALASYYDFAAGYEAALSVPIEGGDKGDGWQPMETAPKDGTKILAAFWLWNDPEKGRAMEVVSWDGEAWSSDAYPIYPPTHWMPLPAAPSASIEGETP